MPKPGILPFLLFAAGGITVLVAGIAHAAGAGQSPPAAAPVANREDLVVAWSQASIVLADAPDPYNQQLAERVAEWDRDHAFQDGGNAAVGEVYNGIRTVIGLVPIVGQAVLIVSKFFDIIGPLIVGKSEGGWDKLPLLARQRAAVYLTIPTAECLARPRPFRSQQIDMSVPTERPRRRTDSLSLPDPAYDTKYKAWLRRYLQETAFKAEFFRITRTDDEVMLPKAVIELLAEAGAWPPPIEPMPLSTVEYRARFAGTSNPAQFYPYSEGPGAINGQIVDIVNTPPEDQARDQVLARELYAQLLAEYQADAAAFGTHIAAIVLPSELRSLAVNSGCVPRLGSFANPIRTDGTPTGGL